MCFFIDKDHSTVKIAEEDIICFKQMYKYGERFESIVYSYKYPKSGLLKSEIQVICYKEIPGCDKLGIIEKGIHSYSENGLELRAQKLKGIKGERVNCICIIPKGAQYYFNPVYREYVSNAIQILGLF